MGSPTYGSMNVDWENRLDMGRLREQRLARLRSVVAARCYGIIPVIEGLHDIGNMSAVCRSADGARR